MATLLVKSLVVASGIGGVAAGGAGVIYLTSNNSKSDPKVVENKENPKQTINDWLKSDQKELLPIEGKDSEWNENWKNFKKKYDKSKIANSSWTFEGSEVALNAELATKAFREKCKTNSESIKAITEALYEDVKNYCAKVIGDA